MKKLAAFVIICFSEVDNLMYVSEANMWYPYWFTRTILNLKNKKNKAYKRFMISGSRTDYIIYSNYRRLLSTEINSNYRNYIFKTQQNLTADPSKFRSFVNAKKKTVGCPSSMTSNGVILSNPTDICNHFAKFFRKCVR